MSIFKRRTILRVVKGKRRGENCFNGNDIHLDYQLINGYINIRKEMRGRMRRNERKNEKKNERK